MIDTNTILPFKWGIGRLVMESRSPVTVMPIYHHGLDKVKPDTALLPRPFHKVTVMYGEPILFQEMIERMRNEGAHDEMIRAEITHRCREALVALQQSLLNEQRS